MAEIGVETPIKLKQKIDSSETSRDIKFKQLTEKYGLQKGAEISLKKINIDPKYYSDIKPGDELKGLVMDDVSLGEPLILYNNGIFIGNTSGVVNIREIDNKLQILTESHSTYEVTVKKSEISVEDKFKQLTEKYRIRQGAEISINKVEIDHSYKSNIKVGEKLSGVISQEIGLGESLVFSKEGRFVGKTSPVINIREKDGRLQFLTQTNSIYEVITEKNKIAEEMEKNIKKHFDKQPKTTKDILNNHHELFVTSKEIDNKIWFFTANYGDKVMSLINSEQEPDIFHPRFFRISGSDHQFKAYPGYRSNMDALKGKEDDKNHHYVQSAKLDYRVALTLQELPKENDSQKRGLISSYMPMMADVKNNILGENLEDFKFSEEQTNFKNESWQKIKEQQKKLLYLYDFLNSFVNRRTAQDFYNFLYPWADYFGINTKKMVDTMKAIPNKNNQWTMENIFSSQDPNLIRFRDELTQIAQSAVEKVFENQEMEKLMTDSHFIPNFDKQPIGKYIKTDGKSKIEVDVFKNSSPEGDTLCWEMATDDKGRTYIDNIYDPTVGIDSYGTPKKKTNMGMLIYKPEDYGVQVTFVPKKYIIKLDKYVDISQLLELSLPVKMYKRRLKS